MRPIRGREKVLRFLGGLAPTGLHNPEVALINGSPSILISVGGHLDTVASLAIEDGLVCALYLVRNPDKLGHVDSATALQRS